MKVVPLRLQPGADLRQALEALMGEQQEQAGCENLLAVIRSLPADDRRWLLRQLEQDSSDLSNGAALAELAMAGGAFDDLAAEPDLYSFSDGEAIGAS